MDINCAEQQPVRIFNTYNLHRYDEFTGNESMKLMIMIEHCYITFKTQQGITQFFVCVSVLQMLTVFKI